MIETAILVMSAATILGGVVVLVLSPFQRHLYMVGNGVCHCGQPMSDHYDTHGAVEMMRPELLTKREWKRRRAAQEGEK